METCPVIALPLALAVKDSLTKQNIGINVNILASYLLEIYPNNSDERFLEETQVVRKQVDEQGNIGDVMIYFEKCDNANQDISDTAWEYLMVHSRDGTVKCSNINDANSEAFLENTDNISSTSMTDWVSLDSENKYLYKVRSEWHKEDIMFHSEDDDLSIVTIDITDDDVNPYESEEDRSELSTMEIVDHTSISSTPGLDSLTKSKQSDQKKIIGNGLKKLLIIGKTGTGKSTLCNVLAGHPSNSELFPVSSQATTCTQETKFVNTNFCGDESKPVTIIDTIGFDDPSKDHDAKIIAELVLSLQQNCDHVNTFIMAVNGQNPRLDGSLLHMIKIFEKMFTDKFWEHIIVVFTRMHMDLASKKRRLEDNGNTDDFIAIEYLKEVGKIFGSKANKLKYLFLDGRYYKENKDEVKEFENHTNILCKNIMKMSDLPTSLVIKVQTENEKLWAKINKLKIAAATVAAGGAAGVGVAVLQTVAADGAKQAAQQAAKETAKALLEKSIAEAATEQAQRALAKVIEEVAMKTTEGATTALVETTASEMAIEVADHSIPLAAKIVIGIVGTAVLWSLGIPLPPPI